MGLYITDLFSCLFLSVLRLSNREKAVIPNQAQRIQNPGMEQTQRAELGHSGP